MMFPNHDAQSHHPVAAKSFRTVILRANSFVAIFYPGQRGPTTPQLIEPGEVSGLIRIIFLIRISVFGLCHCNEKQIPPSPSLRSGLGRNDKSDV